MTSKLSLLVLASLVIVGCSAPSMSDNANTGMSNSNTQIENMNENTSVSTGTGRIMNSLDGMVYTIASFNGTPVEQEYVVAFDDGRMATRICNQISGNYSLEGIKLDATLMSTKMACVDEATTALETGFVNLFATQVEATVTSPNLILEGANGNIILLTEKK